MLYSESSTNDYVRSPPTHRKPQPFSSQRESQKAQIEIKWITNLWWSSSDDTHRTSCYTMHICFVQLSVYLYFKNLSIHWRVTFTSSKNIRWHCREPHHFTEILIINVDENTIVSHGNKDTLLLHATAVSDFFLNYGKSKPCNYMSTAFRQQSSPKDIRHIG